MRTIACAMLIVAAAAPGAWLQAETARQTPARLTRALNVRLPLTSAGVCSAVLLWAHQAGVPVGVECTRTPPAEQQAEPLTREYTLLDLSRMPGMDALDLLIEHAPGFEARPRDGYLLVGPKPIGPDARERPLARLVPVFSIKDASLVQAAESIRRIVDPGYASIERPFPAPTDRPEGDVARQARERYNLRFANPRSLELTNVTIEDILIAVAKAYGGCSWMVQYREGSPTIEDAVISFARGDFGSVSVAPTGPARR